MKILPKGCLPRSKEFAEALIQDRVNNTHNLILIRNSHYIPIVGMLQGEAYRTVYGVDGLSYVVRDTDDIGILNKE